MVDRQFVYIYTSPAEEDCKVEMKRGSTISVPLLPVLDVVEWREGEYMRRRRRKREGRRMIACRTCRDMALLMSNVRRFLAIVKNIIASQYTSYIYIYISTSTCYTSIYTVSRPEMEFSKCHHFSVNFAVSYTPSPQPLSPIPIPCGTNGQACLSVTAWMSPWLIFY